MCRNLLGTNNFIQMLKTYENIYMHDFQTNNRKNV
jgi:hypothetical protein